MSQYSCHTAVVFVIFKRPETTQKVWASIRLARPKKLYIIADSPRKGFEDDYKKVQETRKIVEKIDWPCDVVRDYAESNLGNFQRFLTGLNHVFEKEEAAIVLEDDCLPAHDFFPFCELLLKRYAEDPRVAQINGCNLNWGYPNISSDYYLSRYSLPWGIATWRRAWKHFDPDIEAWKDVHVRERVLSLFNSSPSPKAFRGAPTERDFWEKLLEGVYQGTVAAHAYDYRWKFSSWAHGGMAIMPRVNLIKNIGFGSDATHTQVVNKSHIVALQNLDIQALRHPNSLIINEVADNWTYLVYCLYQEARPWKQFYNNTKMTLGKFRKEIIKYFKKLHF